MSVDLLAVGTSDDHPTLKPASRRPERWEALWLFLNAVAVSK